MDENKLEQKRTKVNDIKKTNINEMKGNEKKKIITVEINWNKKNSIENE